MHHTHASHGREYSQEAATDPQSEQQSPAQQAPQRAPPQSGGGESGQQYAPPVSGEQGAPSREGGGPSGQAPGATTGREFRTRNYLPEDVRRSSVAVLNRCLADVTVLESHLKTAHWNVKGPQFYQLHELFEDVAEMLGEYADEVAERATALGGEARGTARVAARTSTVPEWPPDSNEGQAVLQHVADHLAALDAQLYRAITTTSQQDDLDTADLLNEFSRDVSKALWFVEAHLQDGAGSPARTGGGAGGRSQGGPNQGGP